MPKAIPGLWALSAALAATALPAATPSPANLSETIERFESLRAGSRSAAVKDLHVTCGHLDLLLRSGNVAPIRAGEETVGTKTFAGISCAISLGVTAIG